MSSRERKYKLAQIIADLIPYVPKHVKALFVRSDNSRRIFELVMQMTDPDRERWDKIVGPYPTAL